MNRRDLLAAAGAALGGTLGGCLTSGDGTDEGSPNTTSTDRISTPTDGTSTPADGTSTPTAVTVSSTETTATTTSELTQSIRVTYTVTGGLTAELTARSLVVDPDGRLTKRLDCNTRDGRHQTTEGTLSAAERRDFQRSVLAADPAGLARSYECTGTCAADVPFERIEFEVDGRRRSVRIESRAEVPPELDRVRRQLSSFHDRLPEMDCVAEDGTPTGETVTLTARDVYARADQPRPVERSLSVGADGTVRYRIDCGIDGGYEFEAAERFSAAEHARFERRVLSVDPLSLSADCEDCEGRYLELSVGVDDRTTTVRVDPVGDLDGGIARLEETVERLRERFDPPEDVCST